MLENHERPSTTQDHVARLTRDLKQAARTLSDQEARFLVDYYYQMQRDRIRAGHQTLTLEQSGEPNSVLQWIGTQSHVLESQVKRALDAYTDAHMIGQWSKSIVGIGPIIAAGLMAHIDITRAPTVGHIWRFAGLDPSVSWGRREDYTAWLKDRTEPLEECVTLAAAAFGRPGAPLLTRATTERTGEIVPLTRTRLVAALARRPHNGSLKTLCWKIGESFVKVSGNDADVYGKLYVQRKAYEIERNDSGALAEQAVAKLERFKMGDNASRKIYESGRLPPGHLHARAKRWTVKLFLAHWHEVAYTVRYGTPPQKPYILTAAGGHAHAIAVPNWPMA